jgi:hypothetical protein
MSAPSRNDAPGLNRRDELAVSGAVISEAPWAVAGAAAAVTAGGDMILHLMFWNFAISSPLSLGAVAFFAVAGGGSLLRSRRGQAMTWARRNPWRFAVLPGAACAIVVFVLAVVLGSSGPIGGAFTALWHGAAAYGLTGLAGSVASVGSTRRSRS